MARGQGSPKEWWTRPCEPEGRQGQGHGNLGRKWVAPLVWFEGLELTSKIKELEIKFLKIKTHRTWIIQLLPCKPLHGCSSEWQRVSR